MHVWDDLVDVPTVVPMGQASVEQSEARKIRLRQQQEEMDISAAGTSVPNRKSQDLLGSASPTVGVKSPFNVSRQNSSADVRPGHKQASPDANPDLENGPLSPTNLESFTAHHSPERKKPHSHIRQAHTQPRPNNRTRMSFEFPRVVRDSSNAKQSKRRYSLGVWEDDDEGDLGFRETEEREGNRVQVIVERLETVKGKNPFFTWC